METFSRYREAVRYVEGLTNLPLKADYIHGLHPKEIYLKRMRSFLDLMGAPDKGMKIIHVTGTAGKGSVTNGLHEVLRADGKIVGSFTSPFVTSSIEKIKVGAQYMAPDTFADIVDELKPLIDRAYQDGKYGRPSYFEIFLAIALVYFKRSKCEWIVLEVGLGGRYDATNVIKRPIVTAITNIDYDHTELLGNTLTKIANDKAGIIKHGSKFFTSEQRPTLRKLFEKTCKEEGATYHRVEREASYGSQNRALITAIATSIGIPPTTIERGLDQARLPCRFEQMQDAPRVILDGAHNRSKIQSTIDNLKMLRYRRLILIMGFAENKLWAPMVQQIVPLVDAIWITRFSLKDRTCADPNALVTESKRYKEKGAKIQMTLDCGQALDEALDAAHKDDLILVAGSFYLAGELRKRWYPEERVLKTRRSF